MPTIRKIRAGQKAKQNGKRWEGYFENHCRINRINILRIPDGCRTVGRNKILRVKTPFDYIISKNKQTYLIDTKTTAGKSFSHAQITDHQVNSMFTHSFNGSVKSGYIIYFRERNLISFFDAKLLLQLKPGSSLEPNHGIILGNIEKMSFSSLFLDELDIDPQLLE